MQPINNVSGNKNAPPLQQNVGAFQAVPGQPVPQVIPGVPQGGAAGLPIMPAPLGQNPNVPAPPALLGGLQHRLPAGQVANRAAVAVLVPRNETMLSASALALNAGAVQGLQGQALQTARETVFQTFDQVRIEIPLDVSEVRFICDQNVLSGLNLNYLEFSAPLASTIQRGSTAQAYRFQDASSFLKDALQALNATAAQRNIRPQLGAEVIAASASQFDAMLDLSYSSFCQALKADKLLVYLKVESLLRNDDEDASRFERVLDSLEGHNSLQCLVLADTCIDRRMATQMKTTFSSIPSLLRVDLSHCTIKQNAMTVLRALKSLELILPS